MRLAPDTQVAIRKSTMAALVKARGNQSEAAAALGINRRSIQKRLVALFTPEERAEMAARWGWRGTKQPTH